MKIKKPKKPKNLTFQVFLGFLKKTKKPSFSKMGLDSPGNNSSVYAAELTAIMEAVLWILNCEHYNTCKCKFAIFSDSLSVLTSIKESCSQSRPTLFNDLLCHLSKLDSSQLKFIWIPNHIDVTGNDRANALAKEAFGY